MDIRQLRYFIAIVEERSFSNAAKKLHVAQPALSQHMLALEAAIGVKLLHRNARATVPTEEGIRLLERARKINSDFLTINEHVRGVSDIPWRSTLRTFEHNQRNDRRVSNRTQPAQISKNQNTTI